MSDPAAHPASAPTALDGASNGQKRYLCPYCGAVTADSRRCSSCGGHLDPLSRQATQNTMGPWQVHDPAHPFRPGCSFATVRKLIERGQITRRTILRGPTTRQFWTFADRAPSVANLLGVCHNCHAEVAPEAFLCAACGASFTPETDRQYLGLAPRRPLPGEAPADEVAHLASDGAGLLDGPRRRAGADEEGGEPSGRIQRPAFPADPRPPRQKRSALATIALVGVAGVIGLSLGAAGALAVAAGVGLIDLSGERAAQAEGAEQRAAAPEGEAPAALGAGAGSDAAGGTGEAGPSAPLVEPEGEASPAGPADTEPTSNPPPDHSEADAPAADPPATEAPLESPLADPEQPGQAPVPAVPPRLRRLP